MYMFSRLDLPYQVSFICHLHMFQMLEINFEVEPLQRIAHLHIFAQGKL